MSNEIQVCEFCGMPQMMHMGFDHKNSKCLLPRWTDLKVVFPEETVKKLMNWEAKQQLSENVELKT